MAATVELTLEDLESTLSVRKFEVREGVSRLFEIYLKTVSTDHNIMPASVVGCGAMLRFESGVVHTLFGGARSWSGVCTRFELVEEPGTAASIQAESTYALTISPRLWLLTQRTNHRIFQRMSAPEIVDVLFGEWNVETRWSPDRKAYDAYPKFEYRVQYGETDFAFASRILEEDGISYALVEKDISTDKTTSVVVLSNRPQGAVKRGDGGIQYVTQPSPSVLTDVELVTDVHLVQEARPKRFVGRDFDFRRPNFPLFGKAPASSPPDELNRPEERYVYMPGASARLVGGAVTVPQVPDLGLGQKILKKAASDLAQFVGGKVQGELNKAIGKIAGSAKGLAGKLFTEMFGGTKEGGVVPKFAGTAASALAGALFSGEFDHALESALSKSVIADVNGKLQGLAIDAEEELAGKAAAAMPGGPDGALGKQAGTLVKAALETAAEEAEKGLLGLLPSDARGKLPELLVGDDKGQARNDDKRANDIAELCLEASLADRTRITFNTNVVDLRPSTVFSLSGHPREELAPNVALMVIALAIEYEAPSTWSTKATAVFTATPYRPARVTPKPVIHGLQSALVVGPVTKARAVPTAPTPTRSGTSQATAANPAAAPNADDEHLDIYTDEFGRVRLQFHWDRDSPGDDNSSLWVRVSQSWAGPGYGFIAIPRVGHEVLVAYLEGDPDQPVVVGGVYNGINLVPHQLPKNSTVTALRTLSSPGGGGYNELSFDDAEENELVSLHAARDMKVLVKHNRTEVVQDDQKVTIGKNLTVTVAGAQKETTRCSRTMNVGERLTETINGDHHIKVGGHRDDKIARNLNLTIGPESKKSHKPEKTTDGAIVADAEDAKPSNKEKQPPDGGTARVEIKKALSLIIGPPLEQDDGNARAEPKEKDPKAPEPPLDPGVARIDIKTRLEVVCGKTKLTIDKDGKVVLEGAEFEFSATGPVKINGSIVDLN